MTQFNTKKLYAHGSVHSLNELFRSLPETWIFFSSLTFHSLVSSTCCEPQDAYICNKFVLLAFWKDWSRVSTHEVFQPQRAFERLLNPAPTKWRKSLLFGTGEGAAKKSIAPIWFFRIMRAAADASPLSPPHCHLPGSAGTWNSNAHWAPPSSSASPPAQRT